MNWLQSIIIAIVEGLTEFLPVSSTGHMIITENMLGVDINDKFVNAFTVIIQFGAILSVVVLYWKRFFRLGKVDEGVTGWRAFLQKYDFYWKLLVAFVPAAVIGLALGDFIEGLMGNVWVVAAMLVGVGVLLLLQQGLTRKTAAEFSFFLAVPTMAAATGYELLKMMLKPEYREVLTQNLDVLIIGCVVAFIVAILAIKFFISFLTKYGFKAFGWYRIIVGGVILALLWSGHTLQMVD